MKAFEKSSKNRLLVDISPKGEKHVALRDVEICEKPMDFFI